MFSACRWKVAKKRLAMPPQRPRRPANTITRCEKHTAQPQDFPVTTPAYGHLASLWNVYAGWFVPCYGEFISSAGRHYGVPTNSVLDLACGTGLLSRQLAPRVETVVGLDANELMLGQARHLTNEPNVRYAQGDFRDFSLGTHFDAALCGSDSLNYLQTPGELADVFTCVRRHLRPGGFFVFDVIDDLFCQQTAGIKVVSVVAGQHFEMYYFYDRDRRVCSPRLVFGDAVEEHRRIPIERKDVDQAAAAAGMTVAEHFSANTFQTPAKPMTRQFYVVRQSAH